MAMLFENIEGLYRVDGNGKVIDQSNGRSLKVYFTNGTPCVSIKGKDGIRRHYPVNEVVSVLKGEGDTVPFDTGVDAIDTTVSSERFATNKELVARQIKLILPLLPRNDGDYLESLSHLLAAGLGNRRFPA